MFEKSPLTRNQWLNLKQRPTQFGDAKRAHGTGSHIPAPPITEANQKPRGEDIEPTPTAE